MQRSHREHKGSGLWMKLHVVKHAISDDEVRNKFAKFKNRCFILWTINSSSQWVEKTVTKSVGESPAIWNLLHFGHTLKKYLFNFCGDDFKLIQSFDITNFHHQKCFSLHKIIEINKIIIVTNFFELSINPYGFSAKMKSVTKMIRVFSISLKFWQH